MTTIPVKNANDVSQDVQVPDSLGRKAASGSIPNVWSNEDLAVMQGIATALAPLASPLAVTIGAAIQAAAGENHIGEVGGAVANPLASFSRPADTTAYASGDLVASSTTAGSVAYPLITVGRVATGGSLSLARLRLRKTGTSTTNAQFRVHLYRVAPTFAAGDNAAISTNGVANWLGYLDVTMDYAFTDGAAGQAGYTAQPTIKLGAVQTVAWAIEARAAYTPVSGETFTLEVEVVQG